MSRRVWVTGPAGAFDLAEVPAPSEFDLQQVLMANPQLIPAEDLGLDGELLVIGRETSLASGAVDLLCLARSGDVVIIEFKTGPQNPDFRHALAQVIDYGSDLWGLGSAAELDKGVVQRYLAGPHVDPTYKACADLRAAAEQAWQLDDSAWDALSTRLEQVLETGDFTFVVAAQRFTAPMTASVDYLNSTMRFGSFFLLQMIRLEGADLTAYATQVVAKPTTATDRFDSVTSTTNESDFLARIQDPVYREAMGELLSGVRSLGLVLGWGSKGTSIRLRTPDRTEPLSVGWVFLDEDQWYGARHVSLGADDDSLAQTPSVAGAVEEFRQKAKRLPGAKPVPTKLHAYMFLPEDLPAVKDDLLQLLEELVAAANS